MRARAPFVIGLVLVACAPISTTAVGAAPPVAIRATPKVAAACGPDYLERHATHLADLDGNGTLDRVAFVRDANGFAVTLYEMPSMRVAASLRLPLGYVEVATPVQRGTTRGDLWVTLDVHNGSAWDETLYHLEHGALAAISTEAREAQIRVDVDGDGRVDPIALFGSDVRALWADGTWHAIAVRSPRHVHGVRVATPGGAAESGQEQATDLDGGGVPELVLEHDDSIEIVDARSGRSVWSAKGKPWHPTLLRWGSGYVLAVRLDDQLRVYATDKTHALIAAYPDAQSYSEVQAVIGSQLFMSGYPSRFFERAAPTRSAGEVRQLVGRLDDSSSPFGPIRLLHDDAPGLLAVHDDAIKPLELELIDPQTHAVRRHVWTNPGPPTGPAHEVFASLVDLARDGTNQIVLEDVVRVAFHHGSSWNTSRMQIIDGAGALLWEEPSARTESWRDDGPGAANPMTPIEVDGTHVRAFDLGDGTMALRVRSVRDEYYLLASSSKITAVPACLE